MKLQFLMPAAAFILSAALNLNLCPAYAETIGTGETGSAVIENTASAPVDAAPAADTGIPEARCGYMPCLALKPLQNDVYYTVKEEMPAARQASYWGVPRNAFYALNPGIDADTILHPGEKYLVEARMDSAPAPYSRGKTNRGSIKNARKLPEGPGYFMRHLRQNTWGVDTTIQALTTAFSAYAEKYPGAPEINIGDISKRRGGRINPHKSHQSGRDIDIGFVHKPAYTNSKQHFIRATSRNLDVEKTWFVVESLARTGLVQVIYCDKSVQRMLYSYAKTFLTQEQLQYFFAFPRHENGAHSILQHWPGHRNHFHIRFACPEGQLRCR